VSPLDRRQVLKLFGALAAVGTTGAGTACSTAPTGSQMEQPSGHTIKVGLISPALGPYAKIGADISNGFKLYLADNEGLLGRHYVDLKVAEEGSTAASAKSAADSLLSEDVLVIAGVASPASLFAMRDAIEKAKVPLVSSNASPNTLTSSFYIWRASYVEGEAGRALGPYAFGEGPNAYVLNDDAPSAATDADEFIKAFEDLGGTIVGKAVGTGSYALRLAQAKNAGADVVFGAFTGTDAQHLLDAYRSSDLNVKLVGPGALTETVDLTKLGQLPQKVYTAANYAPDLDNEENRRFVSSYHKAYGTQPSSFAMVAYDTASIINKALRLLDDVPSATALNQALSLLGQIDSPRGLWTFNVNRTPQQKWYVRRLRLDGQVPANLLDGDLAILS
jgi:branched-chain amino acid transport system substrate-binding protein